MSSEKLTSRFVLLCDYAFITSDNKLSIIGEFDQLRSMGSGEPQLAQAFLVGSFEGKTGKHKVMIQFVSVSGEEFSPAKEVNFHIENGGKANVFIRLVNLRFPKQGRYLFQFVDKNGVKLVETKLDVVISNIIPE